MTHSTRFCERAVCWILLAALLALTAFHTIRAFDHSRDEYEGAMIPVTERERGGLPGPDWLTALPYTVTPYGPGFFALAGTASVGPLQRTLIPGRLVSVAAAFLTAVVIVVVVGRRTASAVCGLAVGVLYLGYPIIAYWFHDYRVDALACFFAVAAYAAPDLPRRGLLASALLVVVGSVVKQTVALAAVPVFVHLLLVGRRRDAFFYLGGVAALGALTWGALFYLSHGYYFDLGLWGNRRVYLLRKAIQSTEEFAENPAFIAAAVALIAAFVAHSKPIYTNRYVIALIISWGFAGLLSGGEGAATNYFLESAGLVCILLGIYGVSALWQLDRARTAIVLSAAGFAVIAGVSANTVAYVRAGGKAPDLTTVKNQAATEFVLADRQFIGPAIWAGLTPAVNDPFFYGVVVKNRAVDVNRLVEDMKAGRVSALVLAKPLEQDALTDNKWPAEIMEVMRTHYAPAGRADAGYLYLYVQRPVRVRD
jgi:hypothetical protein